MSPYVKAGLSMISAPITIGSSDGGRTPITARVCLFKATRAPTTTFSFAMYSAVFTMKSGPVELFTTTRPSARMSRMLPMIRGGAFSRSSSVFSRLISFWRRRSSVSMNRFSPSTRFEFSRSLSLRSSRTAMRSESFS